MKRFSVSCARLSRVVLSLGAAALLGSLAIPAHAQITWINYTTGSGLGNNLVRGVYATGSTIYAATQGGGLSISTNNGSGFTNYTLTNGLGSNTVRGVYAAGSTIYAATTGGLSVSPNNGTTWTNYTTGSGLGSNTVAGVYAAGSTIYAATSGGLSVGVVAVPEPSTYAMALAGLACGGYSLFRRRKRA